MKRVEATLRNIIRNPLEAIGYVLAASLVLVGFYLLSPLFDPGQALVSSTVVHGVGVLYLFLGTPFLARTWKKMWPKWYVNLATNFLFMGHLFTLLFILISVGMRPPHFMWSLVCVFTALVVHLYVGVVKANA